MRRRRPKPAAEACPHCGETFRTGAAACPHCGSDAETGWAGADEIAYQSVEIPDVYDAAPDATTVGWKTLVIGLGLLLAGLALVRLLWP